MVGWAKSLNDEYLNEQQYRMNEVMYVLTMVTVMCLPAQVNYVPPTKPPTHP